VEAFEIYSEEDLILSIETRLNMRPGEGHDWDILELITSVVMDIYAFGVQEDRELDYNLRRHVERTINHYPLAFERDDFDYYVH
jgi:hypothetical protein